MSVPSQAKTARIRELNDAFRSTLSGGRVMLTDGFRALPEATQRDAIERVRIFDKFDHDNDPHREHDFLNFEVGGVRLFAKIDYYDPSLEGGSEDPSDPEKTTRVLTIMLASEY